MPRMIRIAAFGGFLLAAAGIGPAQTGDSGKQLRGTASVRSERRPSGNALVT